MSNRLAAAVALAVVVSTSACTSGRTAIAAGAGSLLLGGLAFADGAPNNNCTYEHQCGGIDGLLDSFGDDINEGERDIGAAMMITGAGLLVLGLFAETQRTEDDELAPTSALTFPPAQRVVVDAPGTVERSATPAEMALRSRLENRLAIQASFSARRGDCVAAVATSVRLAVVDPAMHAELVRTDADLANCLARAAAQN